ncbi:MAG TPA: bacteriohemerythrin [Anaeromyxobacteraceae bacterium]|nr:bacteriohemerythrin [Anaeromyxobacteraceae bacterium]
MGIPWTESLEIGIPEIDQQHQELFLRLERLLRGIVGGEREEVGRLLEFLGHYVVSHFGAEERWMIQSGYPDYPHHKAEHDRFMQDFLRIQVEFEQKGPTVLMGMRVNNWVADWLRQHIIHVDMALGRFLAGRVAPSGSGTGA